MSKDQFPKVKMSNNIFSIPIEGWSWPLIQRSLRARVLGSSAFWIVTTNPEILLEAKHDPVYTNTLHQADLRTVDGMGLWLALRLQGIRTTRLTGVELAEHLLAFAEEQDWKVALIGGEDPHRAKEAVATLRLRYPKLRFVSEQGGAITKTGEMDERGEEACARLTLEAPELLFVAFGHPRQERWIARHVHEFPTVRVVVGIGGTIDFWAGTIQRAPQCVRRLGFEWFWRLCQQPARIGRIFRAVIVFPILFLFDHLRSSLSSLTRQGR